MEKMPESQIKLGRDFPPNISMGRRRVPTPNSWAHFYDKAPFQKVNLST